MKLLINLLCAFLLCSITPHLLGRFRLRWRRQLLCSRGRARRRQRNRLDERLYRLPSSLTRGVTYYVAAGTYPNHVFQDADSGSTLITIQAPTSAVHGTNTGWSSAYQGQAVFSLHVRMRKRLAVCHGLLRLQRQLLYAVSRSPACAPAASDSR